MHDILQVNPFRDNHLRTHQTSRRHTKIFDICGQTIYPTWPSQELCHAGTKGVRPSNSDGVSRLGLGLETRLEKLKHFSLHGTSRLVSRTIFVGLSLEDFRSRLGLETLNVAKKWLIKISIIQRLFLCCICR